jgi:hypothetical protein
MEIYSHTRSSTKDRRIPRGREWDSLPTARSDQSGVLSGYRVRTGGSTGGFKRAGWEMLCNPTVETRHQAEKDDSRGPVDLRSLSRYPRPTKDAVEMPRKPVAPKSPEKIRNVSAISKGRHETGSVVFSRGPKDREFLWPDVGRDLF